MSYDCIPAGPLTHENSSRSVHWITPSRTSTLPYVSDSNTSTSFLNVSCSYGLFNERTHLEQRLLMMQYLVDPWGQMSIPLMRYQPSYTHLRVIAWPAEQSSGFQLDKGEFMSLTRPLIIDFSEPAICSSSALIGELSIPALTNYGRVGLRDGHFGQ